MGAKIGVLDELSNILTKKETEGRGAFFQNNSK